MERNRAAIDAEVKALIKQRESVIHAKPVLCTASSNADSQQSEKEPEK